jgi:UDP-N-acetylmuramoylalanine--D-glutamate ligase
VVDFGVRRKVLVIGLGHRSGLSAANFLVEKGHEVEVSDSKPAAELTEIASKLDTSVVLHTGEQNPSLLERGYDCLVLSPGVPAAIPLVKEAYAKKIPVISEIELAYLFMKGMTIGITGTDGKSTTTALTAHILAELGNNAKMGGNIGIPLVSLAEETGEDSVTVIELSSYQLETIDTFRPDAAAFTNLTPDHLDRYDSLDHYFEAKMRITMNQGEDDFFIFNADDERVANGAGNTGARRKGFSLNCENDAFLRNGIVYIKQNGKAMKALAAGELFIMGLHNVQNVMAALLLVQSVYEKRGEVFPLAHAARVAKSFRGLPHRMEKIGEIRGRLFINDSKATTVGAVEMAVRSLDRPGVL